MKKISTFILLLLAAIPAIAQIKYLDPGFGDNGRFNHHFSVDGGDLNSAFLYLTVPHYDGKVLVFGKVGSYPSAVRCNENGTLDSTFASNGEWFMDLWQNSEIIRVKVQPDNKILIGEWNAKPVTLLRLLPDGSPDPLFGDYGFVRINLLPTPYGLDARDIEVLADGRLLVVASYPFGYQDIIIFRLNENGTLSNGFGFLSKLVINAAEFGYNEVGGGNIAITSDNKILVAGILKSISGTGWERGFVRRYSSAGKIDSTFGIHGSAMFDAKDFVGDINLLANGQFIIRTKKTIGTEKQIALTRWNAHGTIDSTYGENGYAVYANKSYRGTTFLQQDEKVIVLDLFDPPGSLQGGIAIRFTQDGRVDSTFGLNGVIRTFNHVDSNSNYGLFRFESGFSLTNEKFIVTGRSYFGDTLVIARYMTGQSVGVIEAPSNIREALLYPNPLYTSSVTLEYELPENGRIDIELFNAEGKWVANLLKATRSSGKNKEVLLLPEGLSNGAYYLNVRNSQGNTFVKLVVVGS
jgi:uncharacterized delta-60 repeat protein